MYFGDAFAPEPAPVALSVRAVGSGQIVFPTSELLDVHGDAVIAPLDVPAVFGTGMCATGGSDVAMAVLSPDSCDSIHMTDHPSELLPLYGAPVFASDIDPRPDLSVGEFGHSLGRPPGALVSRQLGRCLLRLVVLASYVGECLLGLRCSVISCRDPPMCPPLFRFGRTGGIYVLESEHDATSILPGDRVTPLRTSCLSWNCVVVVCSHTFRALWWSCIMLSRTGLPDTEWAGVDSAAEDPLPGIFRGFDLTLQSDRLYDLDSGIPDVIGLRAVQPDAAVIKVMSIPDNRCIHVVIPDDNVNTGGFHKVLFMTWPKIPQRDKPFYTYLPKERASKNPFISPQWTHLKL